MLRKISQSLQENTYARVPLLIKLQEQIATFIQRETLAQVISYENYTYIVEYQQKVASGYY